MQSLITQHGVAMRLGTTNAAVRRMVRLRQIPVIELPTGDVRFDPMVLSDWIRGLSRDADGGMMLCGAGDVLKIGGAQ